MACDKPRPENRQRAACCRWCKGGMQQHAVRFVPHSWLHPGASITSRPLAQDFYYPLHSCTQNLLVCPLIFWCHQDETSVSVIAVSWTACVVKIITLFAECICPFLSTQILWKCSKQEIDDVGCPLLILFCASIMTIIVQNWCHAHPMNSKTTIISLLHNIWEIAFSEMRDKLLYFIKRYHSLGFVFWMECGNVLEPFSLCKICSVCTINVCGGIFYAKKKTPLIFMQQLVCFTLPKFFLIYLVVEFKRQTGTSIGM